MSRPMSSVPARVAAPGVIATITALSFGASWASGTPIHTLIAQAGGAAPGGGTYASFSSNPSVNASGNVAFAALLNGAPGSGGIVLSNGTASSLVMRAGDSTPLGGVYVGGLQAPAIDDSNTVTFGDSVTGGTAPGAIFRHLAGSTTAAVLRNSASPFGGTFSAFSSYGANNNGQFSFVGTASGGPSPGIYRAQGGPVTGIAAVGQLAPGGGVYTGLISGNPVINDAGVAAFTITSSTAGGVYTSDGVTGTRIVALDAPTPLGGTFDTLSSAAISGAGAVAFNAAIAGGTSSGANFIWRSGALEVLAAVGQAAPGLPGLTIAAVGAPKMNDNGVAFFRIQLSGPGVDSTNDYAYVVGGSNSTLELFIRKGDTLTVNGVPRTLTGTPSSTFFSVSNSGVAWRPTFTGDVATVVYTADPRFAVPTPGVAGVLSTAALFGTRRRRR